MNTQNTDTNTKSKKTKTNYFANI